MTGLDVRFGKPIVPIEEHLMNEQFMNSQSANLIGLLINGLYQARSKNYPPGMIVSTIEEEVKTVQPERRHGITTFVTGIFDKAKDGINGLMSDEDSEIN